jgi:hypothetical protein
LTANLPGFGQRLARVATSLPFLAVVATVLSWPYMALAPGSGFDPSWGAALHMAAKEGLDFGQEVLFTYGPWGFLQVPTLWYEDLGILAFVYTVAVHLANCALLLWIGSRFLPRLVALVVVVVLANFLVPSLVITGALAAASYLNGWLSPRLHRAFPFLAGAVAAFAFLGKMNHGIELLVLAGLVLAAAPLRSALRRLAELAGAFLLGLVLLWLLAGQGLDALPDYISLSREVISGHSASLTMPGPKDHTVLAVLAVAAFTVLAWLMGAARPLSERLAATALVALFGFVSFKEGFVRQDFGHEALFIAALVTIPFLIDWGAGRRRALAGIASLAAVLAIALYFEPGPLDPVQRFANARENTADVVGAGEREELIEVSRALIAANPAVSPGILERIGGGTVHVGPYLAATAWAYGFDWRPLPVFQDYLAYTSELDELNADALEAADAPRFILRHLDLGLPDTRFTGFNPPAATVAMLCRYRSVASDEFWVLLERGEDRCGEPAGVGTAEAEYGTPIPVPEPRGDGLVVARLDSVDLTARESLRALLFRARPRTVSFAGNPALEGSSFRLMPGTADDGLAMRIPPGLDLPDPYRLSPDPAEFTVAGGEGSFSVRFLEIPVEPAERPGGVARR